MAYTYLNARVIDRINLLQDLIRSHNIAMNDLIDYIPRAIYPPAIHKSIAWRRDAIDDCHRQIAAQAELISDTPLDFRRWHDSPVATVQPE